MMLQALTATTLALGAALGFGACSRVAPDRGPFPDGDLVDLSHAYDEEAIFWPTAEGFRLERVADGITAGGYYYAANNFCTSEHGGTHLDAPVHFARGAQSVDRIPLDALIGAAIVVDVTAQAEANADYEVGPADFARWERTHGDMPAGAIVLVRTGYAARWPDAVRYLGSSERGPEAAGEAALPGHSPGRRGLAGNRAPGEGRRDRHGQHRPRTVDDILHAPRALRAQRSRPGESRQPGSASRPRRVADRAADEDSERNGCPVARRGRHST